MTTNTKIVTSCAWCSSSIPPSPLRDDEDADIVCNCCFDMACNWTRLYHMLCEIVWSTE